jgi:glycyl-tRNA synthetase beta chain
MGAELLFEMGTEEIPAGFLTRALEALPALAEERLRAARLAFGQVRALGTPRRITLSVKDLADRQADVSELVTGPPAKAAFDAAGKPTKAAVGFAQKNGVAIEALTVVEVPGKGAYVAARREEKGGATAALLPKLLGDLAHAIPWKKSMRWASLDEAFVRPVHWVVALYAGEVVPLTLYGAKSSRETRGHRFLSPAAVALDGSLEGYVQKLREAFVLVDSQTRRTSIEAELLRVEKEAGGLTVRPDPELLGEVVNLVEYPQAVCGSFAEEFLVIPAEVIVSAMRGHQRYFAMEAPGGALRNRFVTVAGTLVADPAVVRHGNERVLAARLSDAKFFFVADRQSKLGERSGKLDGVVFQAKLGTIGEKVVRLRKSGLAELLGVDPAAFDRAAELCKTDLVTKMVGEFPELQGVMGRHYALLEGEKLEVADAILEHYMPRGAQDRLPPGSLGAALGLADRMDTLVGCFAVGLAPTGSADAFGLRRAALAILNLLLDKGWRVSLGTLVDRAARELGGKIHWTPELRLQILEFARTRLAGLLVEQKKLPADCVEAALAASSEDVPDALWRATAVAHLRDRPDFEPLGIAFKRVANILKGEAVKGEPNVDSLAHPSEKALWAAFVAVRERVSGQVGALKYDEALRELITLKPGVDKFFDDVLVMDKDPAVRQNRLALLGTINATFLSIADFRQLAVA